MYSVHCTIQFNTCYIYVYSVHCTIQFNTYYIYVYSVHCTNTVKYLLYIHVQCSLYNIVQYLLHICEQRSLYNTVQYLYMNSVHCTIQFKTYYIYVQYSVHCTIQFNTYYILRVQCSLYNTVLFICFYIAQYPIYCVLRILGLKYIKYLLYDEKNKKYFLEIGGKRSFIFSKFSQKFINIIVIADFPFEFFVISHSIFDEFLCNFGANRKFSKKKFGFAVFFQC